MQTRTLYDHPDLYDRLMPPGPCEAFYAGLLSPDARLLDLGCGTGRLTVPLALRSDDVTALDSSPSMLAAAMEKAAASGAKVAWALGDMTNFDLDGKFDVIMISGNSLAHLTTDETLAGCLSAVRRHLAPSGVFAFDVVNPNARQLDRPIRERIRRAPSTAGLRLRETAVYDPDTRVRDANWRVIDGDGAIREVSFSLRQFFPADLPARLEKAGLKLTARYGEFDRREFTARSRLQVCLAASA